MGCPPELPTPGPDAAAEASVPKVGLQQRRRHLREPLNLRLVASSACLAATASPRSTGPTLRRFATSPPGFGAQLGQQNATAGGGVCTPDYVGESGTAFEGTSAACNEGHDDAWARYDIMETLGRGAVGVVYRAVRKEDGAQVALKVVHVAEEELSAVARHEFELLRKVQSRYIIRALEFFAIPTQAVLVLEFFQGTTLTTAVSRAPKRRLQESTAHSLFGSLVRALEHLHGMNLVHRDVKPDNVLVAPERSDLRLIDFHTVREVSAGLDAADSVTFSGAATPLYAAPEVVAWGEPAGTANDVWAAGLCLYYMLSRRLPRGCGSAELTSWEQGSGLLEEACWKGVSGPCQEVLLQCLTVDPRARPECSEVLASEWMQKTPPVSSGAAPADQDTDPGSASLSPKGEIWSRSTSDSTGWGERESAQGASSATL